MISIKLNISENTFNLLSKLTKNKNKFIRDALDEKINKLLEFELIEGYSKETKEDFSDWDNTSGDGIE